MATEKAAKKKIGNSAGIPAVEVSGLASKTIKDRIRCGVVVYRRNIH